METAANGIKNNRRYSVLLRSQMEKQCTWSSSTVMEVNGNSESMYMGNFFCQEDYICPSVLYFSEVGQIQHGGINMEIKAHYNLGFHPRKVQYRFSAWELMQY